MILEEFDDSKKAFINPSDYIKKIDGFPKVGVSCFARSTFHKLLNSFKHKEIGRTSIANMEIPVYEVEYKGKKIALFNSYVGSAGCVGVLEEIFAMGLEKLVLFGTCGVLNNSIDDCSIIIPDRAVRGEGTSYYYMKSSDEVEVNKKYKDLFKSYLDKNNISYTSGKVWTTDAMYRETRKTLEKRKNEGCICVDMECSAVAAFADFRGYDILHFFYAADNLDCDQWDTRSLSNNHSLDKKHKIAEIAMDMAAEI